MKYIDSFGRMLKESYGRKFLLVLLTLFISTWLVWYMKIADTIYRDIIFTVVAVYISGNVFQKKFDADIAKAKVKDDEAN